MYFLINKLFRLELELKRACFLLKFVGGGMDYDMNKVKVDYDMNKVRLCTWYYGPVKSDRM